MNYGEVKRRVRNAVAAIVTEIDTEIVDWIEEGLQEIHAETYWPWSDLKRTFLARGAITGTATWTQGATTLVLDTGGPATQAICDAFLGGLIRLSGANVYVITGWVQATQTITVDTAIIDASGAAASAQIIQDRIEMASDVESVQGIVDHLWPRPLAPTQSRHRLYPDPFDVLGSRPTEWWTQGVDQATGNVQVVLYPPPEEDRIYLLHYWSRARLPSADGDELEVATGIPDRYHPAIVAAAKWRAFEHNFENDPVVYRAKLEYDSWISKMLKGAPIDQGRPRRLQSDRPMLRGRGLFGRQRMYLPSDHITGV